MAPMAIFKESSGKRGGEDDGKKTTEKVNKTPEQIAEGRIEAARRSGSIELDLSSLGLTELLPSLGQLTELQTLNVSRNQLAALPNAISRLAKLRFLSVRSNQLASLPEAIIQLPQLQMLDVSGNHLTGLPEAIIQLPQLQMLDISGNHLMSLPEAIGRLDRLAILSLARNRLTALPESICSLAHLGGLYVSDNLLTSLPEAIGRLARLCQLDLSRNQLTTLPESLRPLIGLEQLYLHENPDLGLAPEVLGPTYLEVFAKRAQPANPAGILDYYFKTRGKKAETRPLNEAKMILVGRGGVGKTSLVNSLVHASYDPDETRTDGMAITQWPLEIGKDQVRLNIWDFGGQEIMHATHRFFLTKRSLYLLVLSAREGEQDANVEHWLQLIESFGGDSPVLLVINKIKDHAFELNRRGLQAKFPAIRGFFQTDCAAQLGIEELRKAILRETDQLEHLRDPFPASWFTVKDALANLPTTEGQNFIARARYQQLCSQHGVKEATSQETLVGFLHDLGIVVNFPDDPRLADTLVLNPEWVTSGIYRILNSDELARNQGELRQEDLARILDPSLYPQAMHLYLLDLMRKFELCFEFYDHAGSYLVPELLGRQEPNLQEFEVADALRFEYRYNILPEGLLPRFIVRSRALSRDLPRWRSGVLLSWDGNHAVVKADVQDRRVSIAITGPPSGRRQLLAVIRADLEHIHRSTPKLQATEQVPVPGREGLMVTYKKLLAFEAKGIRDFVEEHQDDVVTLNVAQLLNGIEDPSVKAHEPMRAASRREAIRVAFSYSHKDEELRDQLETHLKLLQRHHLISTWHDRKIFGGEKWEGVIDDNFRRADLILLLVSADFVGSDYCYQTEMGLALQREAKGEARVVPVILRSCDDWKGAPFGRLQSLPKDGKPVTSWPNRDEAWTDVAAGIRKVAEELHLRDRKRKAGEVF